MPSFVRDQSLFMTRRVKSNDLLWKIFWRPILRPEKKFRSLLDIAQRILDAHSPGPTLIGWNKHVYNRMNVPTLWTSKYFQRPSPHFWLHPPPPPINNDWSLMITKTVVFCSVKCFKLNYFQTVIYKCRLLIDSIMLLQVQRFQGQQF